MTLSLAAPPLHLHTLPAPRALSPHALLYAWQGRPRWAWADETGCWVASGLAAVIQGRTANELEAQLDDLRAALPPQAAQLPLFGGLPFDREQAAAAAPWTDFPPYGQFALPQTLCHFPAQGAARCFHLSPRADQPDWPPDPHPAPAWSPPLRQREAPFSAWQQAIRAAQAEMARGGLHKVVLARTRQLTFPAPPDPVRVFRRLGQRYPGAYRFLLEPVPGRVFLGATPELLAAAAEGELHTMALAGSCPRGATPDEDRRLAQALLQDEKNRREHQLVVSRIQARLRALGLRPALQADAPRIRRLANIQHLETPIRARLNGLGLLTVALALHPTPALGGEPRAAALAFIRQHEAHPRGWYGAPVGWVRPDGSGRLAVGIRSALLHQETAWLYAGAGILPASDPRSEWEETALKFRPLMEALRHDAP